LDKTAIFYPNNQQKFEALLKELQNPNTKYASIQRWKNNLKDGRYEELCLTYLARFCAEYNTNPDKLIQSRIEELKSSNPLIRGKAEDRLMAYYKKLAKTKPGTAINAYRKICSFYHYNYVRLQTKDPGYVIQREEDYLPSREEIRKMADLVGLDTRVYLVTLAESCARSGALANITCKDIRREIETNIVPCQVWLTHKVKFARKKYFSFICADAVQLWKTYLETFPKLTDETRMFKHYSSIRKEIVKAAKKIGIARGKGLEAFRLHCLRKRGQTLLEKCHVPLNWVDRILGHVPRGAQGGVYSLPDVKVLRAEYSKAMFQLQIYNVPTRLIQNDVAQQQTLRQIEREELQKLLQQASPREQIQIQGLLQ